MGFFYLFSVTTHLADKNKELFSDSIVGFAPFLLD